LTVATRGVLANDTDPEGSSLTAQVDAGPSHGTLSLNPNGSFTYTPAANYIGPDSFTYRASDGTATSSVATVSLNVKAVNNAPVANPESYTVAEDTTLTVAAPGVLGNDTDIDSDVLVLSAGTATAHQGLFDLRSDGSFIYTPAPNYHGPDSFTYQISDGIATSAFTTVNITVTSVNDVPVVANDTIPLAKDGFYGIALDNRSFDDDGDPLIATLLTSTQNGVLVFNGVDRSFTYKPNTGFTGQDSFTYKVNDGTVDSNVGTVTLVIS
jgi:VCBS repeat-containing protein